MQDWNSPDRLPYQIVLYGQVVCGILVYEFIRVQLTARRKKREPQRARSDAAALWMTAWKTLAALLALAAIVALIVETDAPMWAANALCLWFAHEIFGRPLLYGFLKDGVTKTSKPTLKQTSREASE